MDFVIYTLLIFILMIVLYYVVNVHNLEKKEFKVDYPTALIDAFGRQRISSPYTLADYDSVYDNDIDFTKHTENNGSITSVPDESATKLTLNGNGRAVYQSKMYHHYMPGKSQLILMSFVLGKRVKGVTKRVGYFDDNDGIFLEENSEGVLSFNIRTSTSGSPILSETSKEKDWNVFKIDRTKTQLLFIDFQWLGVGKVRCGLVEDSKFVLCHTFYHTNIKDKVYMRNPNLPLRYEINGNGVSNLMKICGTVVSEGGYAESGRDWSSIRSDALNLTNQTEQIIYAIKLKNQFKNFDNRMTVRLGDVNLFASGNSIEYRVLKFVNYDTGGDWNDINSDSGVQYAKDNFNIDLDNDDYYEIKSGFVSGGTTKKDILSSTNNTSPSTAKQNFITQNFNSSQSDVYVITVKELTSTDASVNVSVHWREIY